MKSKPRNLSKLQEAILLWLLHETQEKHQRLAATQEPTSPLVTRHRRRRSTLALRQQRPSTASALYWNTPNVVVLRTRNILAHAAALGASPFSDSDLLSASDRACVSRAVQRLAKRGYVERWSMEGQVIQATGAMQGKSTRCVGLRLTSTGHELAVQLVTTRG